MFKRDGATSPCHTVGTAAEKVTPSVSSSSYSEAPSILAPGITSLQPEAGPTKAIPQALAWNMGTTGRITSEVLPPTTEDCSAMKVCRKLERCEYSTPLGLPVVPEV